MGSLHETLAIVLAAATLAVSIATCIALARRMIAGRPLLARRPRRPVPWTGWIVVLVVGPLLLSLISATTAPPELPAVDESLDLALRTTTPHASSPLEAAANLALETGRAAAKHEKQAAEFETRAWEGAVSLILLAGGLFAIMATIYRADRADLGLPEGWADFRTDVGIGVIGFLAALAPVLTANAVLYALLDPATQHPFVEQALSNPTPSTLGSVALAALVAAPLYEETAFRLLFQGWLERWETTRRPPTTEWTDPEPPPPRGLAGLPPGWAPIAASSVLFGLAHWGHGVAPAPLILLGVILGYIYQRTHRIVPCIVLHMLFNANTMLHVALQITTGSA